MSEVLAYINRELAAIGYPELDLSNAQTIQGTIFSLLKLQQKEQLFRHEQTERIKILEHEQTSYENEIRKLKQQQKSNEREMKQLNMANDTLQKDLVSQKEETKKSKLNLQYCKTHYEHDLKKCNSEKMKMREQLAKLTKGTKNAQSVVINGEFQAQSLQIPPMYDIVIGNYEEHEKEMMYENSLLRQIIFDSYSRLISKAPDLTMEDGIFQLPAENVKDIISGALNALIDRSFVQLKADNELQQLKGELGSLLLNNRFLESKIDENNKKLQEQKQLLELALSSKQPLPNFKSDFEENAEEMKEEWEQLKREKEQLEKERKDFTDAAIRMGVERANLLREKAMLDEEKRAQATAALLNTFPPTPSWLKAEKANSQANYTSPRITESDILVESKTLNTPITPKSKLYRGVRMQSPRTQSLLESAKTVRKQNVIPSRLVRDEFLSSTPK
ncbi:hypothetical protein HDV06_000927 [Boothiomyces sp. JEL0866]|nr:hypothetical protein HDV06_000927 [Boothiomyces sp. JEL0866]